MPHPNTDKSNQTTAQLGAPFCRLCYPQTPLTNSCRVIQKALRCLGQEEVCKLITTFQDKVMAFIFDPNGNHVIQRSIQVLSEFAKADDLYDCGHEKNELAATSVSDQMQLIVDDITKNVEVLSTHRYGCRVVQRAVENCKGLHKHALLDEIISCHEKLIIDQYGKRTGFDFCFAP